VPAQDPFDELYVRATQAAAREDFGRAIELYDQAIALKPAGAEAYYKRGNAQKNLGRLDAALASYSLAIERKPDYAHAYCNRGVVEQALGLTGAALSSYDQAISHDAADAMAHYNRALLMQDCSRWDEALAGYNLAISLDPGFADAQYNRSLALLFTGDWENGWRGFEWRWKNARRLSIGESRNFTRPPWLGEESIAGKRLLLYSEGGLGDTVQFCRYAPMCSALGATVLLEVQPPLLGLLADLPGVSQLIARGSELPPFDYQCPLMSLPLAFKTTLDTIPAAPKYLHTDKAAVARWRTLLGERSRPRIGLGWSGNPNNPIDQHRSIRLGEWAADLPSAFQYFSLQKHVRDADRAVLDASPVITSFSDELLDFVSVAALCECMDLVISVDTSLAHLSGALGLKTWILLPFTPDWRWLRERGDSPWYSTVKLYRQKSAGNWNEVLTRVAADLHREFPAG
jgi:hypothetical protein